jgi:hypothetical protein
VEKERKMIIQIETIRAINNAMYSTDQNDTRFPCMHVQVTKIVDESGYLLITASDGFIAFREKVLDQELYDLIQQGSIYFKNDNDKIFANLSKVKTTTINVTIENNMMITMLGIIPIVLELNFPNIGDVIKNLSKPITNTIKLNFKLLERICKGMERDNTKLQIITLEMSSDNEAIIKVKSKNTNQVAVLMPLKQ